MAKRKNADLSDEEYEDFIEAMEKSGKSAKSLKRGRGVSKVAASLKHNVERALSKKDPNAQTSMVFEATGGAGEMADGRIESAPSAASIGMAGPIPGTDPKDWIEKLFYMTDRSPLKEKVREFVEGVLKMTVVEASEDMGDFMSSTSDTWASHCSKVDEIWDRYVPEFVKACGCEPSDLVKPSGPLMAILCIVWHYPTYNTAYESFGMTLDWSNPCLRLQKSKIGLNRGVLTVNTFPKRMKKPGDGESADPFEEEKWKDFKTIALKYIVEMTEYAKIRLVLGKANWRLVEREVKGKSPLNVYTPIDLTYESQITGKSQNIKLYGNSCLYVVQDKISKNIKQLIIPSFHLERFFYKFHERDQIKAEYCDLAWNIAAALGHICFDEVNGGYFTWKCKTSKPLIDEEPEWEEATGKTFEKVMSMVAWEKSHGEIDTGTVERVCIAWLASNKDLLNPNDGSMARQILRAMQRKGLETQRDPAWKDTKGYQRQREALSRGTATMADPAWKDIEGYQRQQEALSRGLETQRDPAWKNTEGYQRQQEALSRGLETQRDPAWKETDGYQRRLEGMRRGTATTADPAWKDTEGYQRRLEGMRRGLETRRDPAWKDTEGYQRQREAWSRGTATMADPAWKDTEGYQRQQEALARGLETQRDPAWKESDGYKRLQEALAKGKVTIADPAFKKSEGYKRQQEARARVNATQTALKVKRVNAQFEAILQSGQLAEWKSSKNRWAPDRVKRYEAANSIEEKYKFLVSGPIKKLFYSEKNPGGIRWDGDGGPETDESLHNGERIVPQGLL